MLRRRLTFANVIALIALFVSLGGGVYAASKVNGKKIKNASIAGTKLKADTLGGVQINESTLGTVPSAQSADSAKTADTAKSADTAQTLADSGPGSFVSSGDVKRIRFDVTISSGGAEVTRPVIQHGPLTLIAECRRTAITSITITASTTATDAGFDLNAVKSNNTTTTNGGGLGSTGVVAISQADTDAERVVGTFIYNDPTTAITIPYVVVLDDGQNDSRCIFTGTSTKTAG